MHNTLIICDKDWKERKLISHLLAMGYRVERYKKNSRGWCIYDTTRQQQDFLLKWFKAITF